MPPPVLEREISESVVVSPDASVPSPSPDTEVTLEVTSRDDMNDKLYRSACRIVRSMYRQEVGVDLDPKYIAPTLIAAFDDNVALGAVGLTSGEEDTLLTEIMCRDEVAQALQLQGIIARNNFGEFSCLSMLPTYRKILLPILVKTALQYALTRDVRYAIITIGMHVRKHLATLPLELLSEHPRVPPEVAELWAIKYARTNPASFGLPVAPAIQVLQPVGLPGNTSLSSNLADRLRTTPAFAT